MQPIERFNHELFAASTELAQALENAKRQECMTIAHDLQDRLGVSWVRDMALGKQTQGAPSYELVLSLFKTLRDDLRQVIDYGSSAGAVAPDAPSVFAHLR